MFWLYYYSYYYHHYWTLRYLYNKGTGFGERLVVVVVGMWATWGCMRWWGSGGERSVVGWLVWRSIPGVLAQKGRE